MKKNSKYFCNLEKCHYTDKLIPKVIPEEGRELLDQKAILREQSKFYKNLYSTKDCSITEGQNDVFFPSNQNDQFNVLTEFEKDLCEGLITKSEALASLKQMKRNKSPGIDGYSMEFYLFFWKDISDYLINSINTAYIKKEMSVTQKQGLIVTIPKPDKARYYLKNWRPITLLTVDYKIASAVIAERLKKILPKVISPSQKGYLKGRFIGENTRFLYDLMKITEEKVSLGYCC